MSTQEQKTILLVEDDIVKSKITSEIVKDFGFNVITANTGEKAVEIALSNETTSRFSKKEMFLSSFSLHILKKNMLKR